MLSLLVICFIVLQFFAAGCTSGCPAAAASAAAGTGIVPNARSILWGFIFGSIRQSNWRLPGSPFRWSWCCGRSCAMISLAVEECCATLCTSASSASASGTAFGAGVMPQAICILSRFWLASSRCGVQRRSTGGGPFTFASEFVGGFSVVSASGKDGHSNDCCHRKNGIQFHVLYFLKLQKYSRFLNYSWLWSKSAKTPIPPFAFSS